MKPVIVPFFIPHHGCPHACVFCNQRLVTGSQAALPSAAAMLETIATYRRSAGGVAVEVAFYGGTFTALPFDQQRQLLEPLQPLLARGGVRRIRVSTRPDAIGVAAVALLRTMNVSIVELGVQSMSDDVLRRAGRGHSATDTELAIALLRRAGLQIGVQLMPGLPGASEAEAYATLDRVLSLAPDFLRIYPTVVVADTELAELYRAGSYEPWPLAAAVTCCAALVHRAARAGVPVIRVGLQPTAELTAIGAVLAGPFHPAFRQLVESERWYRLLVQCCGKLTAGTKVAVTCAPTRLADLVGHQRRNVARLAADLGVIVTGVTAAPGLAATELQIRGGETLLSVDLLRDLTM
jgi:histone acetyltransferase (RNA polymerase elongator complex component)